LLGRLLLNSCSSGEDCEDNGATTGRCYRVGLREKVLKTLKAKVSNFFKESEKPIGGMKLGESWGKGEDLL